MEIYDKTRVVLKVSDTNSDDTKNLIYTKTRTTMQIRPCRDLYEYTTSAPFVRE